MPETRTCRLTGQSFTITDKDLIFYQKIGVPLPTLCPEERERRRLAWRNERFLYKRECGLCKKSMISIYDLTCKFPVYCEECWWNDQYDPLAYGQDYDFSRPFFEQFSTLAKKVPRLAITHMKSVNSEYTLNSLQNKNCYFTSGADYNEDCMYGINSQRCKNCVDSYLLYDSQLSYGCLDCINAYQCVGCQDSQNINDCWFVYDSKGSTNCAFSSNLRNRKYVLFNKQLTRQEYEEELPQALKELFQEPHWISKGLYWAQKTAVHPWARLLNTENVVGHYTKNSKDCSYVFDSEELQDCKYAYFALFAKDCYDISCVGFNCHLLYEVMSVGESYDCHFVNGGYYSNDLHYSVLCFNSENCFGNIGLKRNKFCIFNKQYPETEYHELRLKIIDHMKSTGEYGEFFPPSLSPFEYNRSAANDYMPLRKDLALERGYRWHESGPKAIRPATTRLSTDIGEIPDTIVREILACDTCGKNYRLIPQELDFYRQMKIPAPQLCWGCRLQDLIHARKPRRLFPGHCKKCKASIKTPYAPERPEVVYCEKCYLADVY